MWNLLPYIYWLHCIYITSYRLELVTGFFTLGKIPLFFVVVVGSIALKLPFRPCANQFLFLSFQTDNELYGIKLPDNCYLFECDQCAVYEFNNNDRKKMWNISSMRSSWIVFAFLCCFLFFIFSCFETFNLPWNGWPATETSYIIWPHINLRCAFRCGIFEHFKME